MIANLAPSGRWMAEDFHQSGRHARRDPRARTWWARGRRGTDRQGRTLAHATADAPLPDGDVVYTLEDPFLSSGAVHALYGNLAPEGSLVKLSATTRRSHRGPARVFDSEEACTDGVRAGRVAKGDVLVVRYEGPAGGPGMREMLSVTASVIGAGHRRVRRARHRRPLFRCHSGSTVGHVAPEAACGGLLNRAGR